MKIYQTIDIKQILSLAILEYAKNNSLKTLTIQQLLDMTGVSRQTFYNHFLDKNDLIWYVYDHEIVPDFNDENMHIDFYDALLLTFQNMAKHHAFMKQACLMEGQNCLKEHIFSHCQAFDLKWHQSLYGKEEMPDALKFATIYHANASSSMTLSWILSDMPVSCEQMVALIVQMRSIGMEELFNHHYNPYKK